MLLSQCLAISLSECKGASLSPEVGEEPIGSRIQWTDLDEDESNQTSQVHSDTQSHSVGRALFERLIQRNKPINCLNDPLSSCRLGAALTDASGGQKSEVYFALKRTHLVGFVVPTWLLVSGALEDLQLIRNNWTSGSLQAPIGMRIDAIGNIRSVRIDYGNSEQTQTHPTQSAATERNKFQEQARRRLDLAARQSKSNTLDSGIQSCDLDASLSGQSCASSAKSSSSTSPIDAAAPNQADKIIICETNQRQATSKGSYRQVAKIDASDRTRARAATQVGRWLARDQQAATSSSLARSVSLSRAFEGRNSPHSCRAEEADEFEAEAEAGDGCATGRSRLRRVWRASRTDRNNNDDTDTCELAAKRQTTAEAKKSNEAQSSTATTWASTAHLSSLFRSKSLRLVHNKSDHRANLWDTLRRVSRDNSDDADADEHFHRASHYDSNFVGHTAAKSTTVGKLSSVLRTSVRTRNQNCDQVDSGATIDYLLGARRARAGSIGASLRRRATSQQPPPSRRMFRSDEDNERTSDESKELVGARSRIAHFLRRLFSVRRQRSQSATAAATSTSSGRDAAESSCSKCLARNNDQQELACDNNGANHGHTSGAMRVVGGHIVAHVGVHQCCSTVQNRVITKHSPRLSAIGPQSERNRSKKKRTMGRISDEPNDSNSTSSDSESLAQSSARSSTCNSSSLIEILDCSRAIGNSTRRLREEPVESPDARRATWRALDDNSIVAEPHQSARNERPDSSLSHQSDKSRISEHSTVSQQLRRHLDKACEWSRKSYTSQRERDFIDSIHVLRQASRHAAVRLPTHRHNYQRANSKPAQATGLGGDRRAEEKEEEDGDEDEDEEESRKESQRVGRGTETTEIDLNSHVQQPRVKCSFMQTDHWHEQANCCYWCASAVAAANCCLGAGSSASANQFDRQTESNQSGSCPMQTVCPLHSSATQQVQTGASSLAPCCLALQRATMALISTGLPPPLPLPFATPATGLSRTQLTNESSAPQSQVYCPFYHSTTTPQLILAQSAQQTHQNEQAQTSARLQQQQQVDDAPVAAAAGCRRLLSPALSLATLTGTTQGAHPTTSLAATLPVTASMQSIALQSEQRQQHQHNTTIDLRIEINGAELARKSAASMLEHSDLVEVSRSRIEPVAVLIGDQAAELKGNGSKEVDEEKEVDGEEADEEDSINNGRERALERKRQQSNDNDDDDERNTLTVDSLECSSSNLQDCFEQNLLLPTGF